MAFALFAEALRRPARPTPTAGQRISASLRTLNMKFRRSAGLWATLATAAIAIAFISRFAVTEVVLWGEWSLYAAMSFVVVGPVFAIWSAILAQRDTTPNLAELLGTTGGSRMRRELSTAVAGVLAALGCYGIVALAVLGFAATRATWGGPNLAVVLFGATMTVLYVLVGWLLGTLVPSRVTPFIAGLGALLYTMISYTLGTDTSDIVVVQPWRYVVDNGATPIHLFWDVPAYPGMPRAAGGCLLALGASATVLAAYLVRRRSRLALVFLALAVVLVAPGWTIATDRQPLDQGGVLIDNPAMICGGEVVQICLHQAYEVQLDDAVAFADAFYAPVVGLPGVPEIVTQQPLDGNEVVPGTVPLNTLWDSTPIEAVLTLPMGYALVSSEPYLGMGELNASQHAILTWLAEQAGGRWGGGPTGDRWGSGPTGEAKQISPDPAASAQFEAEIGAAADRFAALSPEEQRAWLEANWDALRAGDLTLEDLP